MAVIKRMSTPKAPRQRKEIPRGQPPKRKRWLPRGTKPINKIGKGAKGRQERFKKFLGSAGWKAQKKRVHERDDWQCTEMVIVSQFQGQSVWHAPVERCPYTRDDGPLHADHDRYGHRGLENVPDEDIRTKCPTHHMNKDGWKALRAMQVRKQ